MFSSLMATSIWADVINYFANFEDTTSACRTVILWLTIALAIAFIVCKLAVKKEYQHKVNVAALIVALVFAAACIATFVTCSFIEDELVAITFYPLLALVIVCVVGALAIAVKPVKPMRIAFGCALAAALIAALVCMVVYYESGDAPEWNWVSPEVVTSVGLYAACLALVAIIAVTALACDRDSQPFDALSMSFAAMCVAMSFALSYVRFFRMPMGGSITFASMLPVMLYSYMFGCRKGVIAGLVLGVLQAVQDSWLLHPAQFMLDYTVAFAAIGLTGCIRGLKLFAGNMRLQFTLGALIGGVLRFVSHFFSGAFAFGSFGAGYAEDYGIAALSNPYLYSLIYQCMYVIPEVIIVIVVGVILLSSKNFSHQVERYSLDSRVKAKPAAAQQQ